jgi:hypothetical protein
MVFRDATMTANRYADRANVIEASRFFRGGGSSNVQAADRKTAVLRSVMISLRPRCHPPFRIVARA